MPDPDQQGLTPEELEAQAAEELPQREVMSVVDPVAPLRPVPIDQDELADLTTPEGRYS